MHVYPNLPGARQRTILRDAMAACCLLLFAWIAIKVHGEVADLKQLGSGIVQAGSSVQHAFRSAAGAVAGVPIIGSELSHGLKTAGVSTAGAAVTAGHQGESDVARVATTIGWLTFLLPSGLLLGRYLPGRVRQIRRMTAAERVLRPSADESHQRLIAQRAAFSLPYQQLLRHTSDRSKTSTQATTNRSSPRSSKTPASTTRPTLQPPEASITPNRPSQDMTDSLPYTAPLPRSDHVCAQPSSRPC